VIFGHEAPGKMIIFRRITLILGVFLLLVFVGRTEMVAFASFACGLLLAFIPTLALLLASLGLGLIAVLIFRGHKLLLTPIVVLLSIQALILLLRFGGWTAASAFVRHPRTVGRPILDPQLESLLMIGFWLLAALVTALLIDHIVHRLFARALIEENFYRTRIGILLFEGFLLVSMHASFEGFASQSLPVNVPGSVSPTGAHEIRLVPMAAFLDTNGIVIVRTSRWPIWRQAGEIGDLLSEIDSGQFSWSADGSRVYLLLNVHEYRDFPILGYDFNQSTNIPADTYRKQ